MGKTYRGQLDAMNKFVSAVNLDLCKPRSIGLGANGDNPGASQLANGCNHRCDVIV